MLASHLLKSCFIVISDFALLEDEQRISVGEFVGGLYCINLTAKIY